MRAYEQQLHNLADDLLDGRELPAPHPSHEDWVDQGVAVALGRLAAEKAEGCPNDEAYPACGVNCKYCVAG